MRLQQGGTGSSEAAVARRAPQLGSRVSSYEFGLRFASRSNWTPTSAFLGRTAFVFSWSCRLGAQGRATTPRTGEHKEYWTPTYADCVCFFFWSCRLGAQGRATTPRTGQHEDHWTPTYADGVCCFLFWSCRLGAQGRATTPRTGEHKDYRTPTYADRVCFFLSCRLGAQGRATIPRTGGRPPRELVHSISGPTC